MRLAPPTVPLSRLGKRYRQSVAAALIVFLDARSEQKKRTRSLLTLRGGIGHGVVADCVERLTNLSIKEESHACVSLSVRVRVSMHTHVGACGINVCEY